MRVQQLHVQVLSFEYANVQLFFRHVRDQLERQFRFHSGTL